MMLPVSAPFHSSLLKPAADRLAERLATVNITSPSIPVIHNVDVATHDSPDAIRAALARQAASPVRWTETIHWFAAHGVTRVVECGPGKVLAGLTRRVNDQLTAFALTDSAALAEARAALTA
jgi:[acyl-carrier-protein] S-malonyltransferase